MVNFQVVLKSAREKDSVISKKRALGKAILPVSQSLPKSGSQNVILISHFFSRISLLLLYGFMARTKEPSSVSGSFCPVVSGEKESRGREWLFVRTLGQVICKC